MRMSQQLNNSSNDTIINQNKNRNFSKDSQIQANLAST